METSNAAWEIKEQKFIEKGECELKRMEKEIDKMFETVENFKKERAKKIRKEISRFPKKTD